MDIKETLTKFSKYTILHSQYQNAIETVLTSIDTTEECADPSCPMMMGESGTGKSSICKRLEQLMGRPVPLLTADGLENTLPCLYLELPARPTINSVAGKMLERLQIATASKGTSAEGQILTALKRRQTRLVILDEFQNFANKGAAITKAETCGWIKYMLNGSGITFLLSGEPFDKGIIEPLNQVSARFPYRITLSNLKYSADPQSEFRTILGLFSAEIEKLGQFHSDLFLGDEHMSAALYMASGGNMRGIRRLLHAAFKRALIRGDGRLSIEDFADAIKGLYLTNRILRDKNPFLIATREIMKAISR
ncbi:TniB family NTP-binding protein [Pseudomonas kribbensis]|uniref:TniB family NTP-binding protein n=1 Tax=Pseudomonas kribbensis TaxID=1628086 RepID=UPI003BF85DA8